MITLNITFYLSLLLMAGMLSLKHFEIKSGKVFAISKYFHGFNGKVRFIANKTRYFIKQFNRKNFALFIGLILVGTMRLLRSIYVHVQNIAHSHPQSKKIIDMVQGKGNTDKKGAVSFYLKRIAEESKK